MSSLITFRSSSPIRAVLAVVIGLITLQTAHADEAPSFEQVQKWVREEWNRAQMYPPIAGFFIEYEREFHEPLPTLQQVENLRRMVAGKPDHPGRPTLEEYERLLKDGCKRETYRIWSEGPGRFRRSADHHYSPEDHPFFDLVIVRHDDLSWTLNRSELGVYSPESGYPEKRQYEVYEKGFEFQLGAIFSGGLNTLSSSDSRAFAVQGDQIRVTVGPPEGTSAILTMHWDGKLQRAFIRDLRFERAGGDFAGRRMQFSGWVLDPDLQAWRASTVTEFNHDQSIRSVLRFHSSRLMEESEFAEVTAPPTPLRVDAVRGAAAYTRFVDFRSPSDPRSVDVKRDPGAAAPVHEQVLSATEGSFPTLLAIIVGTAALGTVGLLAWVLHRRSRRTDLATRSFM